MLTYSIALFVVSVYFFAFAMCCAASRGDEQLAAAGFYTAETVFEMVNRVYERNV